jgi:hypothetical protein
VGAVLPVVGFLLLRRLRMHRREAALTPGDWLATSLVLNAGRWLRCLASPPFHPQRKDEARLGWWPLSPLSRRFVCTRQDIGQCRFCAWDLEAASAL